MVSGQTQVVPLDRHKISANVIRGELDWSFLTGGLTRETIFAAGCTVYSSGMNTDSRGCLIDIHI